MTRLKAGDYVEVIGGESGGVKRGEQGIVFDDECQNALKLLFPSRKDFWATDEVGWLVEAKRLKLLYRPRMRNLQS